MAEAIEAREAAEPAHGADRWRRALATLWEAQSRWSRTADRLRAAQRSWTGPLVVTGFLGVVLSTLSPQLLGWIRSLQDPPLPPAALELAATVAGPLLVTISAVLTRELLAPKSERAWIDARRVAEELKAEGYLYAAGAPPYGDGQTAPEALVARIDELTKGAAENVGKLEQAATERKHPGEPLDVEQYVQRRVEGQIRFYEDGAARNEERLRTGRRIGVALAVLSAALGVVSGAQKTAALNVWIAVVSTAIATLTAFLYASRYEYLAASYFATAEQLRHRVARWSVAKEKGPEQRGRFLLDCEAILAAQNRAWVEELSKRVSEKLQEQQKQKQQAAGK